MIISWSIHVAANGIFHSFLYLSNIPLWVSLVAQTVKNLAAIRETRVWSLGWENPLNEGMEIHCCILAWKILMDSGDWQATVHEVTKSRIQLRNEAQHSTIFHCVYVSHLLYPFIGQLTFGCFHVLSIVNSVSVITGVQVSMFFSGYMPRSGIVGSHRGCF